MIIQSATDLLFLFDMMVVFRTSVTYQQSESFEWGVIASEYLKGRFFIDFISTVPLDIILGDLFDKDWTETLKLTSTLKLIRIARLGHIIKTMNITRYQKNYFRLYQLGL